MTAVRPSSRALGIGSTVRPSQLRVGARSLVQAATVAALVAATFVVFGLVRADAQDELHRQRAEAAQRLTLEIDRRVHKILTAEAGVYGLANGLATFDRAQFDAFGRILIRRFAVSYVAWAPTVPASERRAFEREHSLLIDGSGAGAGGTLVPALFVTRESGRRAELRPGLDLLSVRHLRSALVDSTERQDPSVAGNARVDGAPGVVAVQPMFGRDETGEAMIAGWVVAGIRIDRLVGHAKSFLPGDAVVRVVADGAALFGPPGTAEPEDSTTMSVGESRWQVSVTGVGEGFSQQAPWIVLATGFALTGLVAVLLWQATRLDHARRTELERLATAALVDNLTGLRNHRAFEEDLARELERHRRSGGALSLVMLDVAGLKTVNDTRGHHEGDELLKSLASSLRAIARASDAVYRLGGDEFAVLLPQTNAFESLEFVQRLQSTLAAAPSDLRVGIVAGIADTIGLETRDSMIRRAGLALVEAKHSERRVFIYSDELEPVAQGPDEQAEERHKRTLATALAQAVDAKDSGTRSHCETVSLLCVMIAEQLQLAPSRIAELRLAGLLHDVGKIGIPDAILQKPARLTDDEFEAMKTHSTLGHSIVMAAGREQEALWILHHHERLDGRGYPAGLRSEEIPLESRVILVADAFEAMTADRPYRKQGSVDDALAELERHAGTQFDPRCVAALRQAIARGSAVSLELLPAGTAGAA